MSAKRFNRLKRTSLVPIWCLTRLLQPMLQDEHPWKNKTLSLDWWTNGATPLAYKFSLFLGLHAMYALILLLHFVLR